MMRALFQRDQKLLALFARELWLSPRMLTGA
jgi:hypothetical protein